MEKIRWEGPGTIESVVIEGIGPIKGLLCLFDDYCEGEEDPRLHFFYTDLKDKIGRLERTLFRLADEMANHIESLEKTFLPDDGQKGGTV